jgi:hypothetical protein
MSEVWYRAAHAEDPLTQGDIIFDCPAITWRPSALQPPATSVVEYLSLGEHLVAEARDLVVMTQACDLEHAAQSKECHTSATSPAVPRASFPSFCSVLYASRAAHSRVENLVAATEVKPGTSRGLPGVKRACTCTKDTHPFSRKSA